jgi:geranylgeranyl pyrophosphate synthase
MLDYTAPSTILGKPTNADLALGLATAPVLFAWRDYPELGPMIKRKFESEGDVERVYPVRDEVNCRHESWLLHQMDWRRRRI